MSKHHHNHPDPCAHTLKMCKKCDVPFCEKCGMEWAKPCTLTHYPWTFTSTKDPWQTYRYGSAADLLKGAIPMSSGTLTSGSTHALCSDAQGSGTAG